MWEKTEAPPAIIPIPSPSVIVPTPTGAPLYGPPPTPTRTPTPTTIIPTMTGAPLYGAPMPTISTTRPTKSGVQFTGWYDSCTITGTQYYKADGTSAKNSDFTAAATLYAKWTSASVTLPTPTR